MAKFLLSVHVLAVIIAVGPVAIAASMFPRFLRQVDDVDDGKARIPTLCILNRICRVYAVVGLAVPVFGFATGSSLGVLNRPWVIVSIAITAVAAAILALQLLPGQEAALAAVERLDSTLEQRARRLAMVTGIFNLLWVSVTILMIARPGSTTGA
jgi:hypothetical protein